MQLWYSPTSPFVRKVLAVAHYHHLSEQITCLNTNAFDQNSKHNEDNPLGRLPALKMDDGMWLTDSKVITYYLDSIGKESSLYLKDTDSHLVTLQKETFADGIVDNAIPIVAEKMLRKDGQFWAERQIQLQKRTINSLQYAEQNYINKLSLDIGNIALVCAIDWLSLREKLVGISICKEIPKLNIWAKKMNQAHPELLKTHPNTIEPR